MAKNQQIIIKKVKKVVVGGHHGGAWKVAYADFVTAMMAFFLLLWLISVSDKATLQGVAQYFTPTESISDKAGLGFDGGADANLEEGVRAPNAASSSLIYGSPSKGHRVDAARLPSNMTDVEKDHFISIMNSIQQNSELKNTQIIYMWILPMKDYASKLWIAIIDRCSNLIQQNCSHIWSELSM